MIVLNAVIFVLIPTKIILILVLLAYLIVYYRHIDARKKKEILKKRITALDESRVRIENKISQSKVFDASSINEEIINIQNIEEALKKIDFKNDPSVKESPSKIEKRARELLEKNII